MPENQPVPLTTEQAIDRAIRMIASGESLTRAANTVSEFRPGAARDGAEAIKEHKLLDYRYNTMPSQLGPVLEALLRVVSPAASLPEAAQHVVR